MKKALISSVILMLIGAAVIAGTYAYSGFDISKFGTDEFETKTYIEEEQFEGISIDAGEADVEFKNSGSGIVTVECFESGKISRNIFIKNGIFYIGKEDTRTPLDRIGISTKTPKITVYLPVRKYSSLSVISSAGDVSLPDGFSFENIQIASDTGDITIESAPSPDSSLTHGSLKIVTDTGNISINGISAKDIGLHSDTGDIAISSVSCTGNFGQTVSTGDTAIETMTCGSFDSHGSSGDISLAGVLASGSLRITRDSGNITLAKSDAGEISIKTSTGDVTGSLMSEKAFSAVSDSGNIAVPRTFSGGRCEITTDTGNITFTVESVNSPS